MTPLQEAIRYADNSDHGGAGYWLELTMRDGGSLTCAVHELKYGVLRANLVEADLSDGPTIWIAEGAVACVRICWG